MINVAKGNDLKYTSLYRRWRPKRFNEVVGQREVRAILKNAVKRSGLSHAYMFAGPRGTGKTSIARILAKAVNCESPEEGEPCNECESCRIVSSENALDIVEIDGASNRGIDKIRELREEVNFMPAKLNYKVYIIDEVHMLTNQAFNALLKTLEEPPERVIFLFATTEPQRIPATIISRCQVFEFKEIPVPLIKERLLEIAEAEEVGITEEAAEEIARKARGAVRDALVIFEQMISYRPSGDIRKADLQKVLGITGEEVVKEYLHSLFSAERGTVLEILTDVKEGGKDLELFLEDCVSLLREQLIDDSVDEFSATDTQLLLLSRKLIDLQKDLNRSPNGHIAAEIASLEMMEELGGKEKGQEETPQQKGGKRAGKEEVLTSNTAETEPSGPSDLFGSETSPEKSPAADAAGEREDNAQPVEEAESRSMKKEEIRPLGPAGEEEVRERWGEMIEAIKEDRISVAAFLQEGVLRPKGEELQVLFSQDFSFHKESLENRENWTYLQEKIRDYFGPNYSVELAYGEKDDLPVQEDKLKQKAKLVQQKFGGTIIEEGRDPADSD